MLFLRKEATIIIVELSSLAFVGICIPFNALTPMLAKPGKVKFSGAFFNLPKGY
jgi:hypothetical protein